MLAAAIREGFQGPVFIQGDHFQVKPRKYRADPEEELEAIKDLIREADRRRLSNIDIDASTLVDLNKPTWRSSRSKNCQVTAEMTSFIRSIEPKGVTISVGGEIGEVGKQNSTVEDLRAFMDGYRRRSGQASRASPRSACRPAPRTAAWSCPTAPSPRSSSISRPWKSCPRLAREEYGMGGAVQHGASTLPDEAFDMFPQAGAVEVHLATGFQNIIYDSPDFPRDLLRKKSTSTSPRNTPTRGKPGETDEQFFYKTRKRAFGDFKKRDCGACRRPAFGHRAASWRSASPCSSTS